MSKKIDVIGRVTDASVHKGTGRHWDEWVRILDRAGARNLTHKEIVAILKAKYKLRPWWQQGVTSGYELHIGRRAEGQNAKGEYSVTVTKSVPMTQKALWKLLSSSEGIGAWLDPLANFILEKASSFEVNGGIYGEVRSLAPPSRVRLSWQEDDWAKPSYLQIHVVARPKNGSILVFQHDGLKTASQKESMRRYWRSAIDRLMKHG